MKEKSWPFAFDGSGYTLFELLISVFIGGLMVISVPPIFKWMRQQGTIHAANRLCADLQQARIMAIQQKQSCSMLFNSPVPDRYTNTLSKKSIDLGQYRGGIHFMRHGPDDDPMSESITFHRRGTAAPAGDVYLSDEDGHSIFRIAVMAPGAIVVYRWNSGHWR